MLFGNYVCYLLLFLTFNYIVIFFNIFKESKDDTLEDDGKEVEVGGGDVGVEDVEVKRIREIGKHAFIIY